MKKVLLLSKWEEIKNDVVSGKKNPACKWRQTYFVAYRLAWNNIDSNTLPTGSFFFSRHHIIFYSSHFDNNTTFFSEEKMKLTKTLYTKSTYALLFFLLFFSFRTFKIKHDNNTLYTYKYKHKAKPNINTSLPIKH